MSGDTPDDLRKAVERLHSCSARLVQSVPIREQFTRATVWEGVVHVFDLIGHPNATTAYAWSSLTGVTEQRQFFAVLHLPPVTSPVAAVQAAIGAANRTR